MGWWAGGAERRTGEASGRAVNSQPGEAAGLAGSWAVPNRRVVPGERGAVGKLALWGVGRAGSQGCRPEVGRRDGCVAVRGDSIDLAGLKG